MRRMILLETDNDLATCVVDYFDGRYDVTRVANLEAASSELRSGTVDVLFADIDTGAPTHMAAIESLRRDHPDLKIVVTYLAPPLDEDWKTRICGCTDLLVRKPYSVIDIDRTLETDGRYGRERHDL